MPFALLSSSPDTLPPGNASTSSAVLLSSPRLASGTSSIAAFAAAFASSNASFASATACASSGVTKPSSFAVVAACWAFCDANSAAAIASCALLMSVVSSIPLPLLSFTVGTLTLSTSSKRSFKLSLISPSGSTFNAFSASSFALVISSFRLSNLSFSS